ncbi:6554_t:CDS:2, partial [Funneliformis mosseae]
MSVMFNADSSLPYIIKLTAGKRSTGMDTDSKPNMDIFIEADEKEKKWWLGKGSLGSLGIDEKSFKFMTAICNATNQRSVYDWGSKSLFTNLPTDEYQEPDACFIPIRLLDALNPVLNPCDRDGSPWPTIILEVASSETLQHVKDKINNYWLVQDRCEDVIVIKIGNWEEKRRNQTTQRPLRRLRCLKFCRTATLQQNPNATTFEAIEE